MSVDTVDKGDSKADEDEDWLESDDETISAPRLSSMKDDYTMASRDTSKVQSRLYDDGYRDGIGIGKEATIQVGFDQGYNGKGAPIGQQYGRLMGTVSAMEQYIGRRGMGMDKLGEEVASLKVTVKALQVKDLVEPDWEALEHERQHGGDASHFTRETQEEKGKRESTLRDLQARVDDLARLLFQTQAG